MRAAVFLQGLISFLLVAFGQPSFSPWLGPIAAALGYALFWRAIRIFPFGKQRFWRAAVWYGSVSLIQLSWMSAIEFQGIYILFVWVGLCIWLGTQFGLLSVLIPYNRPLTLPRILAIASLWTLLEWSRFYFICGYSWNLSGMALSSPYAIQLSTVFGVLGLSFWVIFVNLFGLRAFLQKKIRLYLMWATVACLPYLFGVLHISYHKAQMERSSEKFSCLLVQTGLLPSEKSLLQGRFHAFVSPYDQWKRILTLVKEKREKNLDLIALPEAAVPFSSESYVYQKHLVEAVFSEVFGAVPESVFPAGKKPYEELESGKVSNSFWVQSLSNLFDSDVIIGLDHSDSNGQAYNAAFHAKPFGTGFDRYDKRVLMPLAEYLPSPLLTPLAKSYGITGFFTPGKQAKVFDGKLPMSVSICYEETFPQKVREGRLKGAKLFVNVTNDGWYPFSRLPSQHYEHAKFRAVENGVPLLRACNTGISAAIDSLGRSVGELAQREGKQNLQSGVVFAEITPYEYSTPFMVWGNKGIVVLSLVFLGFFAALKRELRW